jgi:hypothetical protein
VALPILDLVFDGADGFGAGGGIGLGKLTHLLRALVSRRED